MGKSTLVKHNKPPSATDGSVQLLSCNRESGCHITRSLTTLIWAGAALQENSEKNGWRNRYITVNRIHGKYLLPELSYISVIYLSHRWWWQRTTKDRPRGRHNHIMEVNSLLIKFFELVTVSNAWLRDWNTNFLNQLQNYSRCADRIKFAISYHKY